MADDGFDDEARKVIDLAEEALEEIEIASTRRSQAARCAGPPA
jgi:hypothetical protein